MTGGKIQNLQALRGLAVLLVLLCHVAVMESRFGHDENVLPDFYNAGAGGVDLFFVISGFVMVTISRGRQRSLFAFREFLYRRFARIFPTYWVYSLVILAVWLLRPGWVNSSEDHHIHLLESFLLLPQSRLPLLGQGWTLIHEVYFYVTFAFALLLRERSLPRFLAAWSGALVLGWIFLLPQLPTAGSATLRLIFHPLTSEFLLGAASALWVHRTGARTGAVLFFAGCLALGFIMSSPPQETATPARILMRGLPLVCIVHGAVAMEARAGILFPRLLREIGEASYSIYLSHIIVISAIGRTWSRVPQIGLWDNVLVSLLMMAAAIGAGFGSHRFVELPLLRLAHRWRPVHQSNASSPHNRQRPSYTQNRPGRQAPARHTAVDPRLEA